MSNLKQEDFIREVESFEIEGALGAQQNVYKYADKNDNYNARNEHGKYTHQKNFQELRKEKSQVHLDGAFGINEGKLHADIKIPGYYQGAWLAGGLNPAFPSKERIKLEQEVARDMFASGPNIFLELSLDVDVLNLSANAQAALQHSDTIQINRSIKDFSKDSQLVNYVVDALSQNGFQSNLDEFKIIECHYKVGPKVGVDIKAKASGQKFSRDYNLGEVALKIASPKILSEDGSKRFKEFTLSFTAGFRATDAKNQHQAKNGKHGILETKVLEKGLFRLKIDAVKEYAKPKLTKFSNLNQQEQPMKTYANEKNSSATSMSDFSKLLSNSQLNGKLIDLFMASIQHKNSAESLELVHQCQAQLSRNAEILANINGQVSKNGDMITKLFKRMDTLEAKLLKSQNSAEMMAHYQGLINCCDSVKQFGSVMNNDLLFFGGLAGSAFVQSLASVSKFTGIVSEGKMDFLNCASFGAGLFSIGLNVVSSIIGRKKSKKAAQQEAKWRNAVMDGFKTMVDNFAKVHAENLKCHGIQLDYAEMNHNLTHEQLNDVKMDINKVLNKNNKIAYGLFQLEVGQQKILFKFDDERFKKFTKLINRFNNNDSTVSSAKILEAIKGELEFSVSEYACNLQPINDQIVFPGWYYLKTISKIQKNNNLENLGLYAQDVPNVLWWHEVVKLYCEVLPKLRVDECNIQKYTDEINTLISGQAKAMQNYLDVLAEDNFFTNFYFSYYRKIHSISQKAELQLDILRTHYSLESRKSYADAIIEKNKQLGNNDMKVIQDAIKKNISVDSDASKIALRIQKLAKEYNETVIEFQNMYKIVFGVFNSRDAILDSVNNIKTIPDGYYSDYRWVNNITPSEPKFSYFHGPLDSVFPTIVKGLPTRDVSSMSIIPQIEAIKRYMTSAVINSKIISYCVLKSPLDVNTVEPDFEYNQFNPSSDHFPSTQFKGNKPMLNQTEINELNALLEPLFIEVLKAKDKLIIYVLGCTGDGKSSLINYLTGTEYEIIFDDASEERILVLREDSPEPICFVAGGANSATSYPKIVTRKRINTGQLGELCDMPGFGENRGQGHNFVSAIAPHVLSKYPKHIKLMWVINHNHFDTGRYAQIKEMLRYFLKIGGNDVSKLIGSLCITVTRKKTTDPFTKKGLANAFEKMMDSTQFSTQEVQHLSQLRTHILDESLPMKVANINDNDGASAKEIIGMVNDLEQRSANNFGFSDYCPDLTTLTDKLQQVASFYLANTGYLSHSRSSLNKLEKILDSAKENIDIKNEELCTKQAMQEATQQRLEQLNEKRIRIEEKIQVIQNKNDYVILENEDIVQSIEAQTYPEIEHSAWPNKNKPEQTFVVNSKETVKIMHTQKKEYFENHPESQGWNHTIHPVKKKDIKFKHNKYYHRITSNRNIDVPRHGNLNIPIAKTIDAACKIKAEYSPANQYRLENCSSSAKTGYHATLVYPIGEGCKVRVKFSAPENFHPENQKALQSLQDEVAIVRQSIAAERRILNQTNTEISELTDQIQSLNTDFDDQNKLFEAENCAFEKAKNVLGINHSIFERVASLIDKLDLKSLHPEFVPFIQQLNQTNSTETHNAKQSEKQRHWQPHTSKMSGGKYSPSFFKGTNTSASTSIPKHTQSNKGENNQLPVAEITENNMIEWGCLNLMLRDEIENHPQCKLSTSIIKLFNTGFDRKETVVNELRCEINDLPDGHRLFIPLHVGGNHFTLLTITRSNGQLSSVYCDSNNNSSKTAQFVDELCRTDLHINQTQWLIRPYQPIIAHENLFEVSNDCAVYAWYFCKVLCNANSFTQETIENQVSADNMDTLICAKQKRLQFAQRLDEIIAQCDDKDKVYSSCNIDGRLYQYCGSFMPEKTSFKM